MSTKDEDRLIARMHREIAEIQHKAERLPNPQPLRCLHAERADELDPPVPEPVIPEGYVRVERREDAERDHRGFVFAFGRMKGSSTWGLPAWHAGDDAEFEYIYLAKAPAEPPIPVWAVRVDSWEEAEPLRLSSRHLRTWSNANGEWEVDYAIRDSVAAKRPGAWLTRRDAPEGYRACAIEEAQHDGDADVSNRAYACFSPQLPKDGVRLLLKNRLESEGFIPCVWVGGAK